MLIKLRTIDVEVLCVKEDCGVWPGLSDYLATGTQIIAQQPAVRVLITVCDENEFRIMGNNKTKAIFVAENVPLSRLYDNTFKVRRDNIQEELVINFGMATVDLMRAKAAVLFSVDPNELLMCAPCPRCCAKMHVYNPMDLARHSVGSSVCVKDTDEAVTPATLQQLWTNVIESEHLRVMNVRLRQKCDYLSASIGALQLSMSSTLHESTRF